MIVLKRPDPLFHKIINKLADDYYNGGNSMSWLDIEEDAPDTHDDYNDTTCYYNDRLKKYTGQYGNHSIHFSTDSGLTLFLLENQL